jgi:hypothetical protein
MSVRSSMLAGRGTREGQSMTIAINKWIGTLASRHMD